MMYESKDVGYVCGIGAFVCFVELRFWQKLLFVVQHAFEMQE